MHPRYSVPIIPQNLQREETIVQIADALSYLNKVSDDIFHHINARIETNTNHLSGILNRINTASKKISNLTGAKKATRVFSSSKYPAVDVHRQYKSIFDNNEQLPYKRSKIKHKDLLVREEPLETLQFYHVKVRETDNLSNTHGLGAVPRDVNSVNDLLLYNTGKNPYKNYVISDPLQASLQTKKDDILNASHIDAAPHSISERKALTRSATDSYFYSPDLGDVPSIDVPLDLPDLPGIADDLRYVDEIGPGIAPSVTTTPSIPDLPPLDGSLVPSANEDVLELLPPPPPPPILEEFSIKNVTQTLPEVEKPEQPSALNLNVSLKETMPTESFPSSKPPVAIDDAHANLMEAIRQAGGSKNAKLKTAEAKKDIAPSGDLMADLHAKLSLRRKGISGTKNQDNQNGFDPNSAMNKISAMIPPPISKDQSESTNTEDEDWDE